jgi:hypothetical protein
MRRSDFRKGGDHMDDQEKNSKAGVKATAKTNGGVIDIWSSTIGKVAV